ncbi:acyl-CoA dehydratase activase [Candidatus Latescibacterota bacterium]
MKHSLTVLGMDLGSRNIKLCLMKDGLIGKKKLMDSMEFYRTYGIRDENGFSVDISALGYSDVDRIIATGYGRMSAELTGAESISELKAHFLGACYQIDIKSFTLLDMGGQDYKVIRVKDGKMVDMATNDKCAASTGRYLENMSQVLGISIEDIGKYHEDPVNLSNTCAIFGESELIGLIVRGEPVHRLAAGINSAVVERIVPLLERMGEKCIVLSGGVALNSAVVKILGMTLRKNVTVLEDPVYNGAIGCCLFGYKK